VLPVWWLGKEKKWGNFFFILLQINLLNFLSSEMNTHALGSENRQWGPVAPLGSRPWRVRSGPEIHQKIGNFKTFNIYSFQTRSPPANVWKSRRWAPISCISRYTSPICPFKMV
jgi:hypothetical protein